MPLVFPATPAVNDTFTSNGRTWKWDGVSWNLVPISHTHTMADLVDFAVTNPASNNLLSYNGSKWANVSSIPQTAVTNLPGDLSNKLGQTYSGSINFNNYVNSGVYRFDAGNTNGPESLFDYGNLLVIRGTSDTIAQVVFNYYQGSVKVRSAYGIGGTPVWTNWKNIGSNSFVADKSADYTITGNDAGNTIRSTGGAITVTIPNVLQAGDRIDFIQWGTGQITFAASGVTLASSGGKLKTTGQYSGATIMCMSYGVYCLIGDIAA